jgi:hypothetical protein
MHTCQVVEPRQEFLSAHSQAALASLSPEGGGHAAAGAAPGIAHVAAVGSALSAGVRSFSSESAAEALATSALADVMLQLAPSEVCGCCCRLRTRL